MELKRFFVDSNCIQDGVVTIVGDEHIHISNVLRFRVGYKLIVCDNSGFDFYCTVNKITSNNTICTVDDVLPNKTEHDKQIILLFGLIKAEKFEIGLQKAVELGVNKIIPFISTNTDDHKVKMERLNRIVLEACKQCGRAKKPLISEPIDYQKALQMGEGLKIIAYEKETQNTMKSVMQSIDDYNQITFVIGSEGGFTASEIQMAKQLGYQSVTLGKRILRAETAVISGLANISLFLED